MIATELVTRRAPAGAHGVGPRHVNGWFELSFVEAGELGFALDGGVERLALTAGEVGVLAPWVENTPMVRGLAVHQLWLSPAQLAEAADAIDARVTRAPTWRFAATSRVAMIARAIAIGAAREAITAPAQAALVDALALALFDRADRVDGAQVVVPRAIRRAIARIADDYRAPLTVEALAADAGLTRFAFHRAFVAATGTSPYRYLTALRLDRAAEQLRARRDSVLAIALACGFGDPGRFARAFRARFGVSPRQYRAG